MMHAIGRELAEWQVAYTPYYADRWLESLRPTGLLERTVLGGELRRLTERYLAEQNLVLDGEGRSGGYDLVVTCSDLIVQKNIRRLPIVLVQEGMTDPENRAFRLVRRFGLPRWLAST